MCIGVCLHVFLCTDVAFRVQKIPLGLELPMAVSHHVGVGGLNSGPQEEQPVLLTLSHLASLLPCFLKFLFCDYPVRHVQFNTVHIHMFLLLIRMI